MLFRDDSGIPEGIVDRALCVCQNHGFKVADVLSVCITMFRYEQNLTEGHFKIEERVTFCKASCQSFDLGVDRRSISNADVTCYTFSYITCSNTFRIRFNASQGSRIPRYVTGNVYVTFFG